MEKVDYKWKKSTVTVRTVTVDFFHLQLTFFAGTDVWVTEINRGATENRKSIFIVNENIFSVFSCPGGGGGRGRGLKTGLSENVLRDVLSPQNSSLLIVNS